MKLRFTFLIKLLSGWFCATIPACTSPGAQYASWVNLKKYSRENRRMGLPQPGEKRVVFFGDSITESWKTMHPEFFEDHGYINRGASGQATPQMLLRFSQDVISLRPAVVVILAGINDIAQNAGYIPADTTAANIFNMAEQACAAGIRPVICSVLPASRIPWRDHIQPAGEVLRLNTLLQVYCRANGITYVNYYAAMVNAEGGLDGKHAYDGVHPTREGYLLMEPLVQKAITENMALEAGPCTLKAD